MKTLKFEVPNLTDEFKRIYDLTYFDEITKVTKKVELKDWSRFYPSTIKDQFVDDLINAKKLDEIEWIFNNVDDAGLDMSKLKSNVMSALRKTDGTTPIDELKNLQLD